ncbi:MAG: hypothetical protein AAGB05_09150 [Pseudomonadota bacterium]
MIERPLARKAVIIFGPPCLILALLFAQPWIDARWAFPDPIVAAQSAPECCSAYFGVISNIGILYWWTAATACACAAAASSGAGQEMRQIAFMASAAMFSAWLGLDDLLLLHERILPRFGLSQSMILGTYALAGLAYLCVFARDILRKDATLLGLGLAALGISLGLDLAVSDQSDWQKMLEDSAKFIGVAGWAGFHIVRAWEVIGTLVAGRARTPQSASGSGT